MADADEDVIPTTFASGPDDDLEDETQDFRFLAQLTSTSSGQPIVPKRGTKDFEPNPTRSQASALDASRLAMHTALSAVRVHTGKHVVGQYLPDEKDWRWDDNGAGVRHGRCVVVPVFKGTHSKVMGQADRYNRTWFLPEEALFLLDRGTLDIRWPDAEEDDDGQDEAEQEQEQEQSIQVEDAPSQELTDQVDSSEDNSPAQQEIGPKIGELPMSLQGAYASFIGKDGLTLERYTVYAGLKRTGYIVQRAPTWHDHDPPQVNGHMHPQMETRAVTSTLSSSTTPASTVPQRSALSNAASLVHRLVSWLFRPNHGEACPALGPLVGPGLYRNYTDIFRALALIQYHDPDPSKTTAIPSASTSDIESSSSPQSRPSPNPNPNPRPPFRVHFHVWKASGQNAYRKTAPPPPDFRIAVIDARTTSVPTLAEIGDLLDSQPDDALPKEKAGSRLETRIKHGRKNVLLAVVDMGVVSYLRLSDACFGAEKLFEEKARAGSKGKRSVRPQGGGGGGGGGRKGQGGRVQKPQSQSQQQQQQQQQQQKSSR
ncbi:tRNA-splicing endonuclease subunit sen54 [Exophiala xenobiotica]